MTSYIAPLFGALSMFAVGFFAKRYPLVCCILAYIVGIVVTHLYRIFQ